MTRRPHSQRLSARGSGTRLVAAVMSVLLLVCHVRVAGGDQAAAAADGAATSHTISADEFTASTFAQLFRAGEYERALDALQPILTQYPEDPLVLRYQAMTLDRLGRSDEAVTIYQRLLKDNPDHAPTRFFLGQAYERMGRHEDAVKEWRWVAERSPAQEYRQWAKAGIARAGVAPGDATRPRWLLVGDVGWDWDSNVILKPEDDALAVSGDQNAGRWTFDAGLRYRAVSRRDTQVDLLYMSRQSLHDDSLDDFNFTSQEFEVNARQRLDWLPRGVTLGGRYELLSGWLEGDLFSLANRFLVSAESRLTPRTKTVVAERLTFWEFGPDGSNPPQTSRDGVANDLSLTQYFYAADLERYLFLRQEYNAWWAEGGNFDRRGTTTRVGVHTPLAWRTDLDTSTGFLYRTYPHFTSLTSADPERRRDTTVDVLVWLTHHLTSQLDVRLQYRWVNAQNRNDLFQYDRHLAGVHVLFTQAF